MAEQVIRTAGNKVRAKPLPPVKARSKWWITVSLSLIAVGVGLGSYFAIAGFGEPAPQIVPNGAFAVIRVPAGGNFQAALDRARPGDTIELAAGATFKGKFKLPNKAGTDFITIRTSADDSRLPPAGKRLDYKKYADVLPKIVSNIKGEPAITTAVGAHHFRFIGVEFGPTIEGLYNIIEIGTTDETAIEQLPHHIEFDRVALLGDPKWGQRRGIAANGKFIKIENSYFADFKREGEESQAIAVWASDGPIEIVNNYLEAAAENILFGGAQNALGLVAADCIIRDNHLNKPIEWKGTKWNVKNFIEIKSGRRIKIENNLMTNNWQMAQEGTGVLFRTAADSGPQAVVEDIEFAGNIMRGSGSAINIFGGEGKGGRNLIVRNNLFEDISGKKYDGRGFFIKSTTFANVVIENNTVIHDGSITLAYGDPVKGFVFRNNIVFNNEYGFFGDNVGPGKPALATYFPGAVITNNVIVGGKASDYGTANFYPPSIAQIGFIDAVNGNFQLDPNSPYAKRGYGGKGLGAMLDPRSVGGR
ncbi:MAG: right-handed parallel beta-helix repeat-containing protein [Pyrinomonadaceae bacterium]|nr:right-handed parallel beta-helix repeat-containing protein [Pyrinomonadaceae bacterium]